MTAEPDDQFDALELIRRRLADDRPDPQVSVVNVGVVDHPVSGTPVLALVARRGVKLSNLRRHPRLTLVVRAGWEWVAAVGDVELIGPDDPHPHVVDEARRQLLRGIFHAAGRNHPDLDTYDRELRCSAHSIDRRRPRRSVPEAGVAPACRTPHPAATSLGRSV